jgi:curved DNA-binding protein CbpA
MKVLELDPPLTAVAVKARYKELVKRHHPDANGGDQASEEKIKLINEAYATIMNSLGP